MEGGLYWPKISMDANDLARICEQCQNSENVSQIHKMPKNSILEVELFEVWEIDFIAPFISSCWNNYIVVDEGHISK